MRRLQIPSFRHRQPMVIVLVWIGLLTMVASVRAQSLEQTLEWAAQHDPALQSSRLYRQATEEGTVLARARLLPQVSIQGGTQQVVQTTTQEMPSGLLQRSFSGPSATHALVLRQMLIRPKELSAVRQSDIQAEQALWRDQGNEADFRLRVIQVWIDWWSSLEAVRLLQAPVPTLHSWVAQEARRLQEGEGTRDAWLEAQAQFQQAQAQAREAELNLQAREQALALLLRQMPSGKDLPPWPDRLPAFTAGTDAKNLWARVLETSPDLRSAQATERLQQERLRMLGMDHLPTLDLVASFNQAANDATSTQGFRYQNRQLGIQYTVPLYSGGGVQSAVRQQAFLVRASEADRVAIEQRLASDFMGTWAGLQGVEARLDASREMVQSAQAQVRAMALGMTLGLRGWSERASAELNLSRRQIEQQQLLLTGLRHQIRLLRMLPPDDVLWQRWLAAMRQQR